jgi:hypothetical protein
MMPLASVNPLYRELDARAIGLPQALTGPTGKVFLKPNGEASTHLNARDDERIFPMLVPNQIEVDALLYGRPPTREQYERAEASAQRDPASTVPLPPGMRGDSPEADAFEMERHRDMERGLQHVRPFLR